MSSKINSFVNSKTNLLWLRNLVASAGSFLNSGHYLVVVGVAGSPQDPALRENPVRRILRTVPTRTIRVSDVPQTGTYFLLWGDPVANRKEYQWKT